MLFTEGSLIARFKLDVISMQRNSTKCVDTLCSPFNCGAVASIVDRSGMYARILGQRV